MMHKHGRKAGSKKVKNNLAKGSSLLSIPLNTKGTIFLDQTDDGQLNNQMDTGHPPHASDKLNSFSAASDVPSDRSRKKACRFSVRLRSRKKGEPDQSNSDAVTPIDTNEIISQVVMEINETATGINDGFHIDGQASEMQNAVSNASKQSRSIKVASSRSLCSSDRNKKAKNLNKLNNPSQLLGKRNLVIQNNENNVDTSAPRKVQRSQTEQPSQYNKKELSAALTVIKKVMEMDEARPFNNPVNSDVLPEYYEIIHTPMDFGTICQFLEHGHKYMNSEDVYKDVNLIWANCYKYNKKGDYLLHLMKRVRKNFMKCWLAAGLYAEMPNNGHLHLLACTVSTVGCGRNQAGMLLDPFSDTSSQQLQDQSGCNQARMTQVISSQQQPHASQLRPSTSQCHIQLSSPTSSQLKKSSYQRDPSQSQNDLDTGRMGRACGWANTGGTQYSLPISSPTSHSSSCDLLSQPSAPMIMPTPRVQATQPSQFPRADQPTLGRSAAGSITRKKRGRGKTVGRKIANLQPGERFQVDFDMFSRPIGEHRPDLVTFIGTLVRNTENVPMQVKTWRDVPKELRDKLCQLVQEKFELKDDKKKFVERRLNNLFRNYRCRLKRQFYDPYPTPQERMAHRPRDISVEDWEYLCNLWSTSDFQAMSSRNKVNRRNLEMPHVTGRRSFAQIEVDEVAKSGQAPSRVDMFELTRKRKKGGWIDNRAEEAQMRELCAQAMTPEEVFTRFLGPDRRGRFKYKGWVPISTDHSGFSATREGLIQRCGDTSREVEEAKRRAELAEKRAEAAEGRAEAAEERAKAAEKKAEIAEFSATEAKQSCSLMQEQLMTFMTELKSMMTGLPLMHHAQTSQRQSSKAFDD